MNKQNQKILGIAVLVAVAMLVIGTGVVFAAGLAQSGPGFYGEDQGENDGPYWGPMHGRRGGWSSEAPFPPMHEAIVQAVADATGLSVEDIELSLADGEHMVAIALDAGLSEEDFFALMTEVRETVLAEAFEAGLISEERYQWMLEGRQGEWEGRGYGGCHSIDGEGFSTGGRGPGRGRGGRW